MIYSLAIASKIATALMRACNWVCLPSHSFIILWNHDIATVFVEFGVSGWHAWLCMLHMGWFPVIELQLTWCFQLSLCSYMQLFTHHYGSVVKYIIANYLPKKFLSQNTFSMSITHFCYNHCCTIEIQESLCKYLCSQFMITKLLISYI